MLLLARAREKFLHQTTNHFGLKYLLVLCIYLGGIFSRGTHNTDDFVKWISEFIHGNFYSLYHVIPHQGVLSSDSLMVPYPPFSLYLLGTIGKLLSIIFGATPTVMLVSSNFTSVIFTFSTGALLFYWSRQWKSFPAVLYLLTPAVFLISPILGYQDSIMSFFILAALLSAEKEKYFLAGLLASFAVLAKQLAVMPVFGLGLLIVFSLNWKAIDRVLLGFIIGFLVILSPFILTGTLPAYFRAQGLASIHTMMSAQNPNVPWLISLFVRIREYGALDLRSYSALPLRIADTQLRQILYLSFGIMTVVVILLWLIFWSRRLGVRNISALYIAAVAISSYNLLSFGVHENHFFMAIPVLFAIAATKGNLRIYAFASGALALNLLATGGLGRSINFVSPLTQTSGVLYTLNSVASLALYLWATYDLLRIAPTLRSS